MHYQDPFVLAFYIYKQQMDQGILCTGIHHKKHMMQNDCREINALILALRAFSIIYFCPKLRLSLIFQEYMRYLLDSYPIRRVPRGIYTDSSTIKKENVSRSKKMSLL